MTQVHKQKHELRRHFIKHTLRNVGIAVMLVIVALGIGMWGYHTFDDLPWVDAFMNAAMILSGMGPAIPLQTTPAKLFAGFYALFSGLVFILVIGLLLAPYVAHSFKRWHLDMKS